MKTITPHEKAPIFKLGIEQLLSKTKKWISEIEFIKVEQQFLRELLTEHVISHCTAEKFNTAKLLLSSIDHEDYLGTQLIISIKEHKMNLALLIENIYLKKEDNFRKHHEILKIEYNNYTQNFKYLKEQVFELVLQIMKKEKEKKLLLK